MSTNVLVIIGTGGIGQAIARRQGAGKLVLLADSNAGVLESAARGLQAAGYNVTTRHVDVSMRDSVHALANFAAGWVRSSRSFTLQAYRRTWRRPRGFLQWIYWVRPSFWRSLGT